MSGMRRVRKLCNGCARQGLDKVVVLTRQSEKTCAIQHNSNHEICPIIMGGNPKSTDGHALIA